jgi:hypothetical protein
LPFSIQPGLLFLRLSFGVQYAQAAAGSLDTTFGTNGVTMTSVANTDSIVNSILLLSGDKILVFAGGATLVQYTSGGALDTTLGNDGVVFLSTPIGGSLAVQSNGQIVIGGVITPSTGGAEFGLNR